jgi:5-methylcytosine-specific restriction endonuclease McrA
MTVNTLMAQKAGLIEPGASLPPPASWHSEVYKPSQEREDKPEWDAIVKVIKARDKHMCQSCHMKVGLTVHHILSRKEGGTDFPPNLITLCKYCHDEIEELGLKVREQIKDYKYDRKYIKRDTHIVTNEKPVRWQQWVYGGYQKP